MKSIRSKLMASIIFITVLTSISLGIIYYRKSAQMIENNYSTVLHERIRFLADNIDDTLQSVSSVNLSASSDGNLKNQVENYLKKPDSKDFDSIEEILKSYKMQNDSIASVYLILPDTGEVITSQEYPSYRKNIDKKSIKEYEDCVEKREEPAIVKDIVHKCKNILSFVEPVKNKDGNIIAYVCSNIEESVIFYDYIDRSYDENIKDIVILNGNRIVASKKMSEIGKVYKDYEMNSKWMSGDNVTGADDENIYTYSRGNFSGFGVFAKSEKRAILNDLNQMKKYIVGIVMLILVLSLFPAYYITQKMYDPIEKLIETIKEISKGNMSKRANVVSNDEIGLMSNEFNRMLDKIEELIEKLRIEDELRKNAELEALQYQITPHFMYNTLNSIKCYSLINGDKEVADAIADFVELLQTSIRKKGTFLTVSEEIKIIEKYVSLQGFRSGEKIDVEYNIEDEARVCLIPRLILQPIVENAVIHGIDIKKKQGRIDIHGWVEKDVLYIEVKDNGRGMTDEQIEKILTSKEKKTRGLTAVGIPNVMERLELYYKNNAGLRYKSDSSGTTAMIYLPVIKDEV